MMDRAAGVSMAAPVPWAARDMIMVAAEEAVAETRDAVVKTVRPVRNMVRRSKRSESRPPKSSSPPESRT